VVIKRDAEAARAALQEIHTRGGGAGGVKLEEPPPEDEPICRTGGPAVFNFLCSFAGGWSAPLPLPLPVPSSRFQVSG